MLTTFVYKFLYILLKKLKCFHTICKKCYKNIEINKEVPCPLCFKRSPANIPPTESKTIKDILSGCTPRDQSSNKITLLVKNLTNRVFEVNISVKKKIKDLFVLQNGSKYRTSEYGQGHDILLSSYRGTSGV